MSSDDTTARGRDRDSAVEQLAGDFVSRTASANGTAIRYGRGGSGPVLVLLHGFPQDWYAWRRVMPRLAQGFTVIAVDLRGVGGSAAPAHGYTAADMAEDVHQLLGTLSVDRAHIGADRREHHRPRRPATLAGPGLVAVLAGAGLRASELCGLNLADVALSEEATMRVRGKGSKERTVPLPPEVAATVAAYLPSRDHKIRDPAQVALFLSNRGHRLQRRGLDHLVTAGSPGLASANPPEKPPTPSGTPTPSALWPTAPGYPPSKSSSGTATLQPPASICAPPLHTCTKPSERPPCGPSSPASRRSPAPQADSRA